MINTERLTIHLENKILERHAGASVHALVAEGVDRVGNELAELWKLRAQSTVSTWTIDPQRLVEQDWIAEWRTAVKMMGINAAKTRSSIEQLAKRALAGSFVQIPIPAVNLYCHVSTIARVPMGGYDIAALTGELCVRMAQPGDTFLGIGERQPVSVPQGVIVYADGGGVCCYAWNHRDSSRTCLRATTEKAIFFADACTPAGRARASYGLDLLTEALSASGAKPLARGVLDGSTTILELSTTRDTISG